MSNLVVLVTNDDGIEAPGLEALRSALSGLGRTVVVAPDGPRSGCGHALTTHQPVGVEPRGADLWAVRGTPADCVRLALDRLATDVGWVVSGINAGGNLGLDLLHSGTAAAAREAALRGVPAVAISHYIRKGLQLDWDRAADWTQALLRELLKAKPEAGSFWNVNLPHGEAIGLAPLVVRCSVDPSPLPSQYRWSGNQATYEGVYAERPRLTGLDIDVCFGGQIALSLVPAVGFAAVRPPEVLGPVGKPFTAG